MLTAFATGVQPFPAVLVATMDAGQYLRALDGLRHAMQIETSTVGEESVGAQKLINTAQHRASSGELHMLEEAWAFTDRGLKHATAGGETQGIFYGEVMESRVRTLQGRYADAAALLAEARQELDTLHPTPNRMKQGLEFAQARLERLEGRLESALGHLNTLHDALLAHSTIDKPSVVAQTVLRERSDTLAAFGRPGPALVDARAAVALARSLHRDAPSSAKTGKALLTLAELHLATGEHAEALASAREAARRLDDSVGPHHADTVAATTLASR